MSRSHSDALFGDGVLAETVKHFHIEAIRKGTAEAWQTAYDEIHGIDFLWIVYTGRLRAAGQQSTGVFESVALSNQLRELMSGCDQFELRPGAAAEHRATCKRIWDENALREARQW